MCNVASVPELGATPRTASVSAFGSTGDAGRDERIPAAADTTIKKIAARPVSPALIRCALNDRVVPAIRECLSTDPHWQNSARRYLMCEPPRVPHRIRVKDV